MSKPIEVQFAKRAPDGFSDSLRRIADRIDAGDIKDVFVVYVEDGCYCFEWGLSKFDAVGMSAMAHRHALDNMRA